MNINNKLKETLLGNCIIIIILLLGYILVNISLPFSLIIGLLLAIIGRFLGIVFMDYFRSEDYE